jgi:hypothetical protein
MRDWKSAFQQEDGKTARARQQLRRERVRLLLKRWDGVVNDLLHRIARETWREDMSRVTFNRTIGQQFGDFGIHWEASIEQSGSYERFSYVHKAYFRVALVTTENFSPGYFLVEHRERKGHKNKYAVVDVTVEGIRAAMLEAWRAGPAVYTYFMEE